MAGWRPGNFSWAVEDLLAGSSFPHKTEHLEFLVDEGVKYLVTLSQGLPPLHTCPNLVSVHISMPDFTPPKMEQIEEFVSLVEKAKENNEKVAVHCHLGQGRTGTMIACYFVKAFEMPARSAISKIREIRPRSIETSEQEKRVYDFEEHIKNTKR